MYVVIVAIAALIGGVFFWDEGKAPNDVWKEVGNYHEGLAWVQDANWKCGYIDKTGRLVIPCQWNRAGIFSWGLARVMDADGKWGYIDETGQVVIPCKWNWADDFREGLAKVQDANNNWFKIDTTGKVVEEFTP